MDEVGCFLLRPYGFNAVHTWPSLLSLPPSCRLAALPLLYVCAGLGSACSGSTAPPTALPYALAPDVLNLDACPDCVTYDQPSSQGYTGLATWRDSNLVPGMPESKVVSFTKSKLGVAWAHDEAVIWHTVAQLRVRSYSATRASH